MLAATETRGYSEHALAEQLLEGVGRQGLREEESLCGLTAVLAQERELFLRLDSFGHDHELQAVGHGDDGAHDGRVVGVRRDLRDEAAVDLQIVEREVLEVAQRGVAGAEVVDADDARRAPAANAAAAASPRRRA